MALLAGALQAPSTVAAPAAESTPAAPKAVSKPDVMSAALTARSQGSKVEVESLRSETSTTWANPDGTMTTEAHMSPVRFKSPSGDWQSVDLNLAKEQDGLIAPKSHSLDLRLGKRNAVAGGVFASAVAGAGRQVEWLAPWKLPEPALAGTKATYTDVQPGVDLTVDARRSGFETDLVVKTRPATAPVWRFPLRTKGLTARQAKNGVIEFVDAKNVVRSRIPVAYMWDSAVNKTTGDPLHKAIVKVTVEQVSPGKATLVVAPDTQWLLDPARVFPVTVDPTYVAASAAPSFDTFVQTSVTTDLSSWVDLRAGKNGTHIERSFLNFPTAPFAGKDIVSAHLSLYQYGAMTCTPTAINVHSADPASTSTTWTAQPATGTTVLGTATVAKGFSSACASGRISVPMTALAKQWATSSAATVGLALKAGNESDVNHWKRFGSSESGTDPFVSFTWNRKPNAPATVEPSEAVAYAAPGETTSSLYSPSLRPWVRTKATDPDGNTVKYVFEFYTGSGPTFSLKGTCTSSVYASGTTAGCSPATDLPDNTLLYIRAKANDGRVDGPWVNYNQRLRTGAVPPPEPVVTCPSPYDEYDKWHDTAPTADVVCTITATGTGFNAPGYLRLIVDGKQPVTNVPGGAAGQIRITPSSDPAVAKWDVTFPKDKAGLHTIVVQAQTPAGKLSPNKTHKFGWGGSSLTSPTSTPRITTADNIRVTASGPPRGTASTVTARVKWRVSGYGGDDDLVGWNEDATVLPVTDNGAGGVTVNTLWNTDNAKSDAHLDADPSTPVIEPTVLNDRIPVKLDVQVCFKYGSTEQCTWSQSPGTTVQRLPHAFGNGFPTADAGTGQVALWTGELNISGTDISVPGYTGDLSISRSHMTYEVPTDQINGAFGQGWIAQFDGADAGAAGMQVIDSTKTDGTIILLDGDGTTLTYESPTAKRRTTASFETGTWVPVDEDTEQDGSSFRVTGSGANTVLSYVEDDGTVTTWSPSAAPTTAASQFRATGIAEPGVAGKTTFSYDANGRVVRILAPTAPGVTCPATGTLNPGCRALRFNYVLIGASRWRLSEAWLDIYDPAKSGGAGMNSIKVAAYTYDVNALLTKVTDPRSGLSTEYTYTASNGIKTMKPPGQVPYEFNYVTVDQREKLDSVTRARPAGDPAGGVATLGKYIYEIPLSGDGLPDLTDTSVARWNQKVAPTRGFAVFGPDHPLSGAPGADDWQYADLQYTDAAGYTVNRAKFGAGAWQYTSSDYNDLGNVIRELDETAIRTIIDGQVPAGASPDQLATATIYNADIKNAAGDTVLTPAGTLVTDTYGPARYATLKDGTVAWVRPHTQTKYDQGAPNNGINPATSLPYRLATTETSYAYDPGAGADLEVTGQSLTDYSAPVSGDADGWALGQVGKAITDVDLDGTNSAGDIVKLTRYDAEGRVIESRQPASNGNDAGTTKTVYFTTAANSTFPECGGKAYWAGLSCKTYPAAQPTSSAGTTPTLPTSTVTGFNYLLATTTEVETSGSVTRTNTTEYLLDGRVDTTRTTVAGLAGSTPNTTKKTTYDPITGTATAITATAADATSTTITTGYDTWGRPVSYKPHGETATTTVYNAAGRVATITDPNGTTQYTYDGVDANGLAERRGMATKVEVATGGKTWSSTGAYDADGSITVQKLPGGVTQINESDNAGEPTGLRYTGQVTTTAEDGTTTVDPNGAWLSWSIDNDVMGRVVREWTPDGAAFTGGTGTDPGDAVPYDRGYTYDNAGRLASVKDRTASATGADITDPTATPCVTRTYGFDRNDNRLTKSIATSGPDGACAVSGGTTVTRAFDTADRPVTGGNGNGTYTYDLLGRTTNLPAADAPRPADGNVSIAYYGNDLARSITHGGTSTSYTLDALDRRLVENTATATGTSQSVRHYTDSGDNPTWVTTGTTWQRYAELVGGDFSLTINSAGDAELALANNHSDVVTTVTLGTSGAPATAVTAWNSYDEYGAPSSGNGVSTGAVSYGWLGAKQRATTSSGLMLMGVRLYNGSTGLFTSVDPVEGGNANAYTYPSDPINSVDLNGKWRCKWCKKWADRAAKVSKYVGYIPFCSICSSISVGVGLLSAGLYGASGDWRAARGQAASAIVGAALGGFKVLKNFRGRHLRSRWRVRRGYRHYHRFVHGGGVGGAFNRAARRAGKGRGYRAYWGLKIHGVAVGGGEVAEHYASRRNRHQRRFGSD